MLCLKGDSVEMKAVCINCSDHYEERTRHIEKALQLRGFVVTHLVSDFNHGTKKKFKVDRDNVLQIKTFPYKKNLSFRRIVSHFLFAKKTYKVVKKMEPDLVYVLFPPNFVAKYMSKYRHKNNNVQLILDIFDLWPESLPKKRKGMLFSIFFKGWANLRNTSLPQADLLLTECELFKSEIKSQVPSVTPHVLFIARDSMKAKIPDKIDTNQINIAYLGFINNIIDIDFICKLLAEINALKPVKLHIIGSGEQVDTFIDRVAKNGIEVEYHGRIYDFEEKKGIFDQCYFGLNIMKPSVKIGLTMKSVDYFQNGLPILNTIPADTQEIVQNHNVGFNVSESNLSNVAKYISRMDETEVIKLKMNTLQFFEGNVSTDVILNRAEELFEKNNIKRGVSS